MRILLFVIAMFLIGIWLIPPLARVWIGLVVTLSGHPNTAIDALDFTAFFSAGQLVAHGRGDAIYSLASISEQEHLVKPTTTLPYLNPPFFALLVAPFTLMSFWRAYQVWTALNVCILGLAGWTTWRETSSLHRPWRMALLLALLTMFPVGLTMELGQFSLLLMACWTAAYSLLRRGHDGAAGLALAPGLIKPELLIPIALLLLWKGRFGVFRTLVPAAALAVAASFVVVGIREGLHYPLYLYENASQHLEGTWIDIMFGWNGMLGSVFGIRSGLESLLALPLSIGCLFAAACCWKRPIRTRTDDLAGPWLVAAVATILADPHLYLQDVALLGPPACIFLCTLHGRAQAAMASTMALGWFILAMGLMPNLTWGVNIFTPFLAMTFAALVFYTIRRNREAASADGEAPQFAGTTLEPMSRASRAA